MKDKIKDFFCEVWPFALVLAIFCLAVLMGGCKSANDIPVIHDTTYVNRDVYINQEVHDSTYIHDSVFVMVAGDTVWITKYHDQYHDVYIHDTTSVHDTSYMYKEVPVEVVTVKKKVPAWCWVLLILNVAAAGWWVYKKWYKKTKI